MINTNDIPGVFENGKITARVGSIVKLPKDVGGRQKRLILK